MNNPTFSQYRAAAQRIYNDEGTCEIDDNAKISKGDDDGAYVQAWVWIRDDDCDEQSLGEDEEFLDD